VGGCQVNKLGCSADHRSVPAVLFRPFIEPEPSAHVAAVPVRPLGPPEPVGNLFALHGEAGIELRVLSEL
jgi:hypothetical protein